MNRPDALRARWRALCRRIGPGGDADGIWSRIEAAYASPPRAYHNLGHIADCLERLDSVREAAARPDEVELALWLHDAIYDATRSDNEARSAKMAAEIARDLGGTACADRVAALVMATRHTGETLAGDAALIADIDLSILASEAREYDGYAAGIRAEYAHVPGPAFSAGRAAFLKKLLARGAIFQSPACAPLEAAARANLRRELSALSASA